MKNYTLSESDRRLLDASLRRQRSDPPRPAIVKTMGKEFESADSWWALPPCETGLPAAIILDGGDSSPGVAFCCIYRLDAKTGVIKAFRDAKGAVVRRWVNNAYPNVINSLVRIHQNKDGDWSNGPIALESSEESTSSTTPSANTTLPPSPCDGECVWIAGADENGQIVWRTPPSGGCRNTTTSTVPPTTFTPVTTPSASTTPMPCSERKCRLRCVQVTTAAGTTSWPPAPYVPLRYEEVLDLDNPGCVAPCTCYGVNDPCWYLNATIESQCLYVNTTTSTSTTTSGPLPNDVCQWLNGGAAGPPNPDKYVAGAWSDFRNGGWQVCNACPEGKEPWITPNKWDYQDQENLIPVARQEFFDVARGNNPGTPWEPVVGAWRFETGCRASPCTLGGAITATEFEAEYRAFTKEDIYRYWIANACSVFGREALREIIFLGDNSSIPGCDIPLTEANSNAIWTRIFDLSDTETTPKLSHRARWSVCKSCPPGTRPVRPPKPYIYELPENTDGALVDGVWVYKTQCVKGIDCSECAELPAFQLSGQPTAAPEATTTPAPCGCEPPKFCPTVANECTRTRCVPGGSNVPPPCTTGKPAACFDSVYQVECDCAGSTTNTTTSSTSTTSTTSSCTQNQCRWVLSAELNFGPERFLNWVQTSGCGTDNVPGGGGSSLFSPYCTCASAPPTTTAPHPGPPGQFPDIEIGVGNCGDVYTANCVLASTSTCAPAGNCLNCSNGCYWGAYRSPVGGGFASALSWKKLDRSQFGPTPAPPECLISVPSPAAGLGDRRFFNPDGSPSCPSLPKSCDEWLAGRADDSVLNTLRSDCLAAITDIPSGCINSCDQYYPNRDWGCGQFGRRKPCVCREPAYPPSNCDWMVFTPCEQIAPPRCACCNTTTATPCLRSCVFKGDGSGGWTQLSNPCLTSCPCPSPLGQSKDSCDRLELACGSRPSTTTGSPTSSTTSSTTTARPQGSCCYSGYNPTGCVVTWQIECTSAGGQWLGAGTNCTSNPCPVTTTLAPLGRCCYNFGQCATNNAAQCGVLGGTWTAGILNCQNHTCPTTPAPTTTVTSTTTTTVPLGRCCYGPDYVLCASGKRQLECQSLNGIWTQGVTCNTASCGGFCCYLSGGQPACNDNESSASCSSLGGTWYSYSANPGVNCSMTPCNTTPAPTTAPPTTPAPPCAGAECTYQSLNGSTWTLMEACGSPCNCPTPSTPPQFEGDVATLNCVSP